MKTDTKSTPATTMGRIETIAIEKLIPTPDNPRFELGVDAVANLAASIKANGLLQPVLARPHPDQKGTFDLRCGHRRLVAAKIAGLKEILTVVRDLTNVEAMEVTITENLQREDLHPLEESMGLQTLLSLGITLAEAARRLGKSERWVGRRAKLANLSPKWIKAIREDRCNARALSGEALEEIAKLGHAYQDSYLVDGGGGMRVETAESLRERIGGDLKTLDTAPWDINDEELDAKAGSCIDCPKRTSREPGLWDVPAKKGQKKTPGDQCLDPVCWAGKQTAFVQVRIAAARQTVKGLRTVSDSGGYHLPPALKKLHEKSKLGLDSWEREAAKEGAAGAIPTLLLDGPKVGTLVWFKPKKQSGGGGSSSGDYKAPVVPAAEAARRKRCRAILTGFQEALEVAVENGSVKALIATVAEPVLLHAFVNQGWADAAGLRAMTKKLQATQVALIGDTVTATGDALRPTTVDQFADQVKLAEAIDELLVNSGLDLGYAAIVRMAKEKFPEPAKAAAGTTKKKKAGKARR